MTKIRIGDFGALGALEIIDFNFQCATIDHTAHWRLPSRYDSALEMKI